MNEEYEKVYKRYVACRNSVEKQRCYYKQAIKELREVEEELNEVNKRIFTERA